MGKRKRSQEREKDDLKKRLKRLEKKMKRRIRSASQPASPGTPTIARAEAPEEPTAEAPEELEIMTGEDIPEELIQALGKEGDIQDSVGEKLQQKLVDRWTNILHTGLGKEAREQLVKKYPTPENFSAAVPPVMNEVIRASMSETSIKRDKRIVNRQVLLAKVMFSLGKVLTNVLRGNINTKDLVEQISDSAKFAAEVFFQDSSSRKFFALAGTTPTIKEAIKDATTDSFLFGKDCADRIKAAQSVHRTGSQIRMGGSKRQENWKGPLQPQYSGPQYRSGQPYHPPQKPRAAQQAQRTRPAGIRRKPVQPQKPSQPRHRRY